MYYGLATMVTSMTQVAANPDGSKLTDAQVQVMALALTFGIIFIMLIAFIWRKRGE